METEKKSVLRLILSSKKIKQDDKIVSRKKKFFQQICFLLLIVVSVFFLIRIKAHIVSGDSMLPTLKNNDRLLVMKGEYPSRYNLITFVPKNKEKESYIKRVLGLPGDRIWLDQNNLYINHQMSSSNLTPENESALLGSELPDGTLKVRVSWEVAAKLQGISSIPEHQYFVLGDNRRHSTDSRQLGLIDFKQIEGVVRFRYYPLDRLGSIN